MTDQPARHEAAIAIALGLVYLALMPGHFQSIDGVLLYEQARSLWFDGSLVFTEPVMWDTAYRTSFYGIGGSLVHVPGVALLSFLDPFVHVPGDAVPDWGRLYLDPVYALAGNPMQAVATAVAVYGTGRMGAELGLAPKSRLIAMALLGLASPAFVYAGSDFSQPLATALLTWAMLQALRWGRAASRARLAVCALLVFCGGLVRPIETVLIAPFLVLAATPELDLRRGARVAAALGGALAAAAAVSLAVNAARFGAPLHNEYAALGARFALSWQGPLGLLVSPAWGLLFAFPALVVVPFGLGADPRDRLDRLSAVRARALVGFPVALWAVIGCWHMWWGGISWGPRLLVPALPFLAVLAARGLDELEPHVAKRIALACFALGLLQALPGVLVDLHGGYGALVSVTSRGWWAVANPALGGWSGLEHVLAEGPLDRHAVDVVWLRLAHPTRFASLGVPVVLLAGAAFIARRHAPALLRAPGFSVRSATWAADEAALRAVRFSVFVDEQAIDPAIEIDAHDARWDHALALDDDERPIGTARLSVEGGVGHIGRVAVLASWRRRGVGEALMRHLIEHASQSGVRRIEISAQLEAVPFYRALGFVAEGEIYSEAGIDHRRMHLDLGS